MVNSLVKNILFFLFVALISFSVGYSFIYFSMFNSQSEARLIGFIRQRPSLTTIPEKPKLEPLLDREIDSIFIGEDKSNIRYFEKGTGRIFGLNLQSRQEILLSPRIFRGFRGGSMGSDGQSLIINKSNGDQSFYEYYDADRDQIITLDPSTITYSLKSDGQTVATLKRDGIIQTIISVERPDLREQNELFRGRMKAVSLEWIFGDHILLDTYGADGQRSLYIVSDDGRIKKISLPITADYRYVISSDNSQLLLQNYLNNTGYLFSSNSDFPKEVRLPEQSNCIWNDSDILCLDRNNILTFINTENGSQLVQKIPLLEGLPIRSFLITDSGLVGLSEKDDKLYLVPVFMDKV